MKYYTFSSFKQLENFYFIYVPAINWLQYFPPKRNIFTTRKLKIKHEKENQNSWLDPMNCTIDKKIASIIFWQNFVKIGHSAPLCAFWNRNSWKKLMRLYKKGGHSKLRLITKTSIVRKLPKDLISAIIVICCKLHS